MMIFDTTFVIDLQRERAARRPGGAENFLDRNNPPSLAISFITEDEFTEGFSDERRSVAAPLLEPFHVLASSSEIAWRYGRVRRVLRQTGQPIGTNDLWIAATALVHDVPVVTRNADEFRRVPGLTVCDY